MDTDQLAPAARPALACSVVLSALCACTSVARGPASTAAEPAARPGAAAPPNGSPGARPPATPRQPVTDVYHGVPVQDDYRWLEAGESQPVRAWTAAQNAHTRNVLERLPDRAAVAARVAAVLTAPQTLHRGLRVAGGRWFALIEQPPKQQAFVVVMAPGGDPTTHRTLVDPNTLDSSGKTTIDWYEPSPDGKRLAVSLSRAGSESGDAMVVDVATGAISDRIPRVNGGTAGGDLAWTPDGAGFYYTRYPAPGERLDADLGFYQQLYFHRLGSDAASDRYVLGKDFPRIAEIRVDVDARTGRVLASVQNGDGGEFSHHLRSPDGRWRKLTDFGDGIVQVAFGPDDDLFAISRRQSPRGALVRVDARALDFAKAAVVHAPERDTLVSSFWDERNLLFGADRWYAIFQLGGPSAVRAFDYSGKPAPFKAPLDIASVGALMRDADGAVILRAESFLHPRAWYRYDEATGKVNATALADSAAIDMRPYSVVRELARSKDGTEVPLNILLPPGARLDGKSPCVVTGYGGYGVSVEPRFSTSAGLWLERGVIYVVANLRGGGEFGQAWHQAGNLTRKQNVFDDFAAVLTHLIARRYTRPERLGIIGGSNGGLLMGATVVQHPELVRAAVAYVGLYDMLRVELSPNGAFNVTEFGTVQDRAQFEALHAYSPYHHVQDGTRYPALLLITGENDPRVDPMHSRKMAARMQAATAGPHPILLRASADTGHGGGSDLDAVVAETTDAYAFMFDALGVTVQ
jgi:prolyl oligopeptidase